MNIDKRLEDVRKLIQYNEYKQESNKKILVEAKNSLKEVFNDIQKYQIIINIEPRLANFDIDNLESMSYDEVMELKSIIDDTVEKLLSKVEGILNS